MQTIIQCKDIAQDLQQVLEGLAYDKVFVLTDTNSRLHCLPKIQGVPALAKAELIEIAAGDENKTLETLSKVWAYLSENGATRKSLLINLGGGMVTDLGGFAAASFKRGILFINIPTTLLGAVDAAVGGKTGINFQGLKNEIGAFAPAQAVLIDADFFSSLDKANLVSGYAEMLKHALLKDAEEWKRTVSFSFEPINYAYLQNLVLSSVQVKEHVVEKDPFEQHIRKALNLGHTVGHAFESLSYTLQKPVLHGYAVAWGLVAELYLSAKYLQFPVPVLNEAVAFVRKQYGGFYFTCAQYEDLFALMLHDKKNEAGKINFTLLEDIGQIQINQQVSRDDVFEALDFCRESFGM